MTALGFTLSGEMWLIQSIEGDIVKGCRLIPAMAAKEDFASITELPEDMMLDIVDVSEDYGVALGDAEINAVVKSYIRPLDEMSPEPL